MKERIRILVVTHSAVPPTGMAEVTRLIFNTLLERYPGRYEIHQVGLMHFHAVTKVSWPIYTTRTVTTADGGVHLAEEDQQFGFNFCRL